jgi:hypothetical protein
LSAGCDRLPLLSGVVMLDNEGWSLYGAERSQLVATGGKWEGAENGSGKRKPLPSVATSCLSCFMVRVHSLRVMGGSLPWLRKERSSPANPKARRTHPNSNTPGCAEAHWTGESDVHDATRRGTDRVAVEPRPVRSVPRCGH